MPQLAALAASTCCVRARPGEGKGGEGALGACGTVGAEGSSSFYRMFVCLVHLSPCTYTDIPGAGLSQEKEGEEQGSTRQKWALISLNFLFVFVRACCHGRK